MNPQSSDVLTPGILVNGVAADAIDATDRGFTLGDGLFETVAVPASGPRFWSRHCERLLEGCRRLGLPAPDTALLAAEIDRLRSPGVSGTARITLTRGPANRGYAAPMEPTPTRVVAFHPAPSGATLSHRMPAESGLVLRWCDTRLARQPALAGIKHLNRLEQVLARSEWRDPGIDEGIMQDTAGQVVECVAANLFLLQDRSLVTPALDECGVDGVVRRLVLQAADALGFDCAVRRVDPAEVNAAQAVFVTNAVRGIAPVARIDDRTYQTEHESIRQLMQWLEKFDD